MYHMFGERKSACVVAMDSVPLLCFDYLVTLCRGAGVHHSVIGGDQRVGYIRSTEGQLFVHSSPLRNLPLHFGPEIQIAQQRDNVQRQRQNKEAEENHTDVAHAATSSVVGFARIDARA